MPTQGTQWTSGIAVVIPCYRVRDHILGVISEIGSEVDRIYVVDDACLEHSGLLVEAECRDERVSVIFSDVNEGVGGATLRGMRTAFGDGAVVAVKMDGDSQMDAALIPRLVVPLINGSADYTKGNRFFELDRIGQMPGMRIFGNMVLSFLTKLSSGYWDIFDPTNGFVAIHRAIFGKLPIETLNKRYFFESDMLFRLNLARAVVIDVPMPAIYGSEVSSLKISRIFGPFLFGHIRNVFKRIFYSYFLRDFSIASLYLIFGLLALGFGFGFGLTEWITLGRRGVLASAGTVMIASLPIILGFQMLLSFLAYDMGNIPRYPFQGLVSNVIPR